MKNNEKTYLGGAAIIAATLVMTACIPKPPLTDGGKDETGCYLEAAPRAKTSLAKNRTAIFIGLDARGQISVGYPNPDFITTLAGSATKEDFAASVAGATNANMVFYPTSDLVPRTPPNPLNLRTGSNTTVAFRLSPEAWTFRDEGFSLKFAKHGGFSPFTSSIARDRSVLLVDYDRGAAIKSKDCGYAYNLLADITTVHGDLTSRLPIILDPDWLNEPPPAPPASLP